MTLTIELTPTEDQQLQTVARRNGVAPATLAHRLLIQHLSRTGRENNLVETDSDAEPATEARSPERLALVKAIRGKYAHTAREVGTEELHRERLRDREKEETYIRGERS